VDVAQKSRTGGFACLFPQVVLMNDSHPHSNLITRPRLEDYATAGSGAVAWQPRFRRA
jgi:hypothetical protein